LDPGGGSRFRGEMVVIDRGCLPMVALGDVAL
jgi:hypothetical protein